MKLRNELIHICNECGAKFADSDKLVAQSPFREDKEIFACPKCKEIIKNGGFLCHNEDCNNEASEYVLIGEDVIPLCSFCVIPKFGG